MFNAGVPHVKHGAEGGDGHSREEDLEWIESLFSIAAIFEKPCCDIYGYESAFPYSSSNKLERHTH